MKPSYSSNFDKTLLLFNLPIEIYFEDYQEPIKIILPSMKDTIYNNNVNMFLELMSNKKYWKNNGYFIVKNKMQMLLASNKLIKESTIPQTFQQIFINLNIDKDRIMFEDKKINEEQFDLLFDMVQVGCNRLSFEDFNQETKAKENGEVSDFLKRQKELEEKIHKSKKKAQQFELDKVIIAILSYFPQYKIQDLMEMNAYTFFQLYEWSLKREYQFVKDVAAGNGLISKKTDYQPLF